jgi:hypothetical protein
MTHMSIVTADDLTQTTANTAQTITLCALVAGDIIAAIEDNVVVSFKVGGASPDNAFNTTTRSLGIPAWQRTAAAEVANGTVVKYKYSNTAVGPYGNKVADLNAMSAKSLSNKHGRAACVLRASG